MEQTITRSKISLLARTLVCPGVATGTCSLLSNPQQPMVWWGVVVAGSAFLLYDVVRRDSI